MDSTTTPTPGRGRLRVPEKPTAAEKQQAREVSLRRIARLFTPYRWSVLGVVAIIVASSIVGLASPFLLRGIIDVALPDQDLHLLVLLTAGMVAVAAVTSVLGVFQTWINTQMGQRVMHGLRTDVFAHLQRQSIAFFTRTRTGEVQSRITNDIGGMQNVVTSTATSIASNLTTTVATAVAMAVLSWRLALISLVVMPPAIWLSRRVARMRREITSAQQRELADLNVTIEEGLSISGIQLAKSMGAGPTLVRRFTESSARLIDLELRSSLAGRWRMASMSVLFAAIPAVIYLSAGLPMTARHHDDRHPDRVHRAPGPAVPAADGAAQHRRPGGQLAGAVPARLRVPRPARRHRRAHRPVDLDPAAVRGHVRFEHVGFSYADAEVPALSRRRPRRTRRHARWRSSARPAPARPRSARWSPGCTTRPRAR